MDDIRTRFSRDYRKIQTLQPCNVSKCVKLPWQVHIELGSLLRVFDSRS